MFEADSKGVRREKKKMKKGRPTNGRPPFDIP
jgi:hypothetical protein